MITRKSFSIFKNNHKCYIEGHRGVNHEYYQNTIPSFLKAIYYNIDCIELDVWLTLDKIPVIVHGNDNGEISNYYNSKGLINKLSLKEIKKFRTLNGNLKMPTLEDVFKICKNKIFINIELKDLQFNETFNEVEKLIKKYNMFEQIQISSFHHEYYNIIKNYNEKQKINKKIEFGFLYDEQSNINNKKIEFIHKFNTINIYFKDISKNIVENAHKNNMGVMVWFGMNDEENEKIWENLINLDVDSICSNFPNKAKIFRDEYYMKKYKYNL